MKISDVKGLYHVILISFRPETPESVRQEIFELGQKLEEACGSSGAGILHWTLQNNRDLRKGVHLVEFAVFESETALENFKNHPKHLEFVEMLKNIADWQVGDFIH